MITKDCLGSIPRCSKYSMISSRVQMVSFNSAIPCWTMVCALFSHTSVPWDRPEIRTSSAKVVGLVSSSIWRTNFVPNSGTPKVPTLELISSSVTPKALVFKNRLMVASSPKGMVLGSKPVKSCSMRSMVGSSCPRMSSFKRVSCSL